MFDSLSSRERGEGRVRRGSCRRRPLTLALSPLRGARGSECELLPTSQNPCDEVLAGKGNHGLDGQCRIACAARVGVSHHSIARGARPAAVTAAGAPYEHGSSAPQQRGHEKAPPVELARHSGYISAPPSRSRQAESRTAHADRYWSLLVRVKVAALSSERRCPRTGANLGVDVDGRIGLAFRASSGSGPTADLTRDQRGAR
jgi:hypothetical protein